MSDPVTTRDVDLRVDAAMAILRTDIANLRTEMADRINRLTWRLSGLIIAAIAAVAAVIRLL